MVYENDIFLAELMLLLLFIAHLPPIYFFALFFFLSITLFLHQSHHFPYPHWIHLFFKFSLVSTSYNLPIFFLAFSLASLYFQFFFFFFFFFLLGVIILGWCTHFAWHTEILTGILVQAETCYWCKYFFLSSDMNHKNHPRFSNLVGSTLVRIVHCFFGIKQFLRYLDF